MKKKSEERAKKLVRSPTTFNQRCYEILLKVPRGKLTTYKVIADLLGTKAYRAVGRAMHNNPFAPRVPCHRVVGSNGSLTGYAFGLEKKCRLLRDEGIEIKNDKVINLNRYLWEG